ncbi:hypothetical protein V6N13_022003 [Hibiscus sabdariffa]|uniref:Uncharacterized protein n=1 Tax=Hibiscus sabdariffa TaxID=183260 RepID=A0ABR2CQB3_9ROSI
MGYKFQGNDTRGSCGRMLSGGAATVAHDTHAHMPPSPPIHCFLGVKTRHPTWLKYASHIQIQIPSRPRKTPKSVFRTISCLPDTRTFHALSMYMMVTTPAPLSPLSTSNSLYCPCFLPNYDPV